MPAPVQEALLFLIANLFNLYLFILMVRLILCWVRADYFNPITQFVVKATNPLVLPLRKLIPTRKHIEFATLTIIFILAALQFYLVGLLKIGNPTHPEGLLLLAVIDAFNLLINTFFYGIFVLALLSWFQQGYSPVVRVLTLLVSPVMRPIQRIFPAMGGFDLSPIPALLLLQVLLILFINPLTIAAEKFTFG